MHNGKIASLWSMVILILSFLPFEVLPQNSTSQNFIFKQCAEHVLFFRMEPKPFQDYVGDEFKLHVDEGKAVVSLFLQDCSQYWVDGQDLGTNQHAHVLVRVTAESETNAIVGAEITLPQMTWFSISAASTNPLDQEARQASGTSPLNIEDIKLGENDSTKNGRVIFSEDMDYSWVISNQKADTPISQMIGSNQILGFHHKIYVRDGSGNLIVKQIEALGLLETGPNLAQLLVNGSTDGSRLIPEGPSNALALTFDPVWARVTAGH